MSRQNQIVLDCKSKSSVTTHLIGDWIIRESLEPFQRKENKSFLSTKQNACQWNVSHLVNLFVTLISKYPLMIGERLNEIKEFRDTS